MSDPKQAQPQLLDRELSWLTFNRRVLQEAQNPAVPLLERLKFLAIFSSNLDEYFKVRVATLRRLVKLKKKTRAKLGQDANLTNDYWYVGAITGVMVFGVMAYALLDYYGDEPLDQANASTQLVGNTEQVSDAIFSQYVVPFEIISVLLLAALVGAIVLARKD